MTENKQLKLALYCRVSKRLGQTTENQIPILENWAKALGYDYEIYEEAESTRKTRPVKEELIQKMRLRQIDGVACVRLDRWLRSCADVVVVKEMVDNGCHFFFVNQGFHFCRDNNNAMTSLQLNMLSAFAEFERELIRERTFEGLDSARANGKTLGRRPSTEVKKRNTEKYILAWATGGKRWLAQQKRRELDNAG